MSNKENEKKAAFRYVDKNVRGGRMDEPMSEELKEKGDEESEMIKNKATEAREVIDSQSYNRRKGHKGLNSPQ